MTPDSLDASVAWGDWVGRGTGKDERLEGRRQRGSGADGKSRSCLLSPANVGE